MAQNDTQEAHYVSTFAEFAKNGVSTNPEWLVDIRRRAIADFKSTGFPTSRRGNELWKYTDVRPIASKAFTLPPPKSHEHIEFAPYDLPCPRLHQLVFVDGYYAADLSTEPPAEAALQAETIGHRSEGLIVGRLTEAIGGQMPFVQEHLAQNKSADGNSFAALATAFMDDGAFVYIPDGVSVYEPIYLLFLTSGQSVPLMTLPRVLIIAGENSHATIVQSYETLASDGAPYLTNTVTEIVTQQGASLHHYRLQREANNAYHVASTLATLDRSSHLTSVTLDLGGGIVRHDQSVTLAGSGAEVSLNGLYIGSGKRHIDNHTFVDHAVPDTTSNEVYKGIMADSSRGVFVGHVLVREGASRSIANQVNKNLVLSDDAEVDSQPKLEIFTDDVQCTHGAAVGRLDPIAVFYLNSRGLDAQDAQELLIQGFVSQVTDAVQNDAIRQYADHAVAAKLGKWE